MRFLVFILLMLLRGYLFAQGDTSSRKIISYDEVQSTAYYSADDSLSAFHGAIVHLKNLRSGTLVVRLKTNEKSIKAYRESGRNEIADRIVEDRRKQNQKIVSAFMF